MGLLGSFSRHKASKCNVDDLDFDLTRLLKVKCDDVTDAVGLLIYDFILVLNSNYMSICHRYAVIGT